MLSPSIDALTSGNCAERVDRRLGDERGVSQLGAGCARTRLSSSRGAAPGDAKFDLVDRVHVRRGVRAEHHVLGDLLAHHRHRHDLDVVARLVTPGMRPIGLAAGRRGPARRAAPAAAAAPGLDEAEDVLLGHAAADAGAVDAADVDVVLLRDPPHERRRTADAADPPLPASPLVIGCRGCSDCPATASGSPVGLGDGGVRRRSRRSAVGAEAARQSRTRRSPRRRG